MKKSPIDHIAAPLSKFIRLEFTGGILLFVCVLIAILWVNGPFGESYHRLWNIPLTAGIGDYTLNFPLRTWINDGLMALFFFVIGLELKREFMAGELSTLKKAVLPMVAALGGMLVPALIYAAINRGTAAASGWGIPMATDIAFALALLSLAGKHIPVSVKVFLSALAVADDLGAISVIALFYSAAINWLALALGGGFLLVLLGGNRTGIRGTPFYLVVGCAVWLCFLLSGVHATIAGVLVAFTIPARPKADEHNYARTIRTLTNAFVAEVPNTSTLTTPRQNEIIQEIKMAGARAETPLQKIEYSLHPWVAFGIMPVFALANAGMVIGSDFFSAVLNPVSLGILLGLVVGKFTGIFSFTWIFVRLRLTELPGGATWRHLAGISLLAGVGFTMSLFITGLAFRSAELVNEAKYGILLASVVAGIGGVLLLRKTRG